MILIVRAMDGTCSTYPATHGTDTEASRRRGASLRGAAATVAGSESESRLGLGWRDVPRLGL